MGNFFLIISILVFSFIPANAQDWAGDFSAIDQRARKSPRQLGNNLPALTEYLGEEATGDLEKVRSIYVWITTHIGYDWKAIDQDKRINHFISDILERRVALCFGYAQLFEKMCDLTGVESAIINGYAKGTTATELPIDEPNHSWNAVRIDGKWYLLDATWGSSTIGKDNDFVLISNDDYFLIRPEQFIRNHLPGNPMWQLLQQPVSAQQFMEMDEMSGPAVDSAFAFQDSLDIFFKMPLPRQHLYNYERTYSFYPTLKNGEQLGHALIDYAGSLSDTLEAISQEVDPLKVFSMQEEIIRYCRRARELVSLYPWQQELYVSNMINQAVLLYNQLDETESSMLTSPEEIIALLEEAQDILTSSKDSYFIRMARQQCASYLEVIRDSAR